MAEEFDSDELLEHIFERVAAEVSAGHYKSGLQAMAAAQTEGDEAKAKALYLQLRAKQIAKEMAAEAEEAARQAASEAARAREAKRKAQAEANVSTGEGVLFSKEYRGSVLLIVLLTFAWVVFGWVVFGFVI